jgi:integrase
MSLYKVGSVWHYSFYWGDRRYRGSTKQRQRARAEQVQGEAMAKVRQQPNLRLTGRSPLVSQLASRFLAWVDEADLAPKTRAYYHNGWRLLSTTPIACMRLSDIGDEQVSRLPAHGSPGNGNNARRTLRRMLSKAQAWGLLGAVPKIRLLKEKRRGLLIDGDREAQLLKFSRQPLRDVLMVMQDTGMRPDEVLRLRWEYIDTARRTMFNPIGKTDRSRRMVPMSDRVVRVLKERRNGETEGWVFPSPKRGSRCGYFSLGAVEHQFKEARQNAGLPQELVLYCARHTYATDALARTGNVAAVMDSMGHANAQTTMIYQHQGLEQLRDAINLRNRDNLKLQRKRIKRAEFRFGQNLGQSTGNGAEAKSVSA